MLARIALLAMAVTTAVTLPADAQRGRRGGHGGGGWAGGGPGPMAGMSVYSPRLLLRMQDRLELTEAQVEQLTGLETEAATNAAQARAALATHRAQMREALTVDVPDANAVRQHLEAAQEARTRLEWVGVDTMLKAQAVLTDEQRAAVRDFPARRTGRRVPGRR